MSNAVKDLIEQIQSTGSQSSNASVAYHLFCGEDITEAFDGSSVIEGYGWREADTEANNWLLARGYEFVEAEGGGEGEGEYCYGVIKIGDEYFKAEWSYYSYNGCEYDYIMDTIRKVTPREKVITIYE